MNSADNRQNGDVREKILRLMQSITHAPTKQLTQAERYKLKAAASRLAQILKAAVEAERQALLSAAERLDRLLSDVSSAKDVTPELKKGSETRDAVKPRHTTQQPKSC